MRTFGEESADAVVHADKAIDEAQLEVWRERTALKIRLLRKRARRCWMEAVLAEGRAEKFDWAVRAQVDELMIEHHENELKEAAKC